MKLDNAPRVHNFVSFCATSRYDGAGAIHVKKFSRSSTFAIPVTTPKTDLKWGFSTVSLGGRRKTMLLRTASIFVSATTALLIAGCAAGNAIPGATLDEQNSGTVKGIGGTVGSFFATIAKPIGITKEVLIFKVNGVKVNTWGSTNLVRLAPGDYQLTVSCSFKIDGMLIQGNAEIAIQIKPGHSYQLDAEPQCRPLVTDITDGAKT